MEQLLSHWSFDWIMIGFIALLCALYCYATGFHFKKQSYSFLTGIILLALCLTSPLHFIGEHYLFSAHMVMHTLLLLIIAPLIVLGLPAENKFKATFVRLSKVIFAFPFLSWLTGVGIMWVWHIPAVFDNLFVMKDMAANGAGHCMNPLSYLQMLSLFIGGIFFCWPIITPYKEYRVSPLTGVLYLSTACLSCSLLGLLITCAPAGLYTHYIGSMGQDHLLSMVRNNWGITALMDQQIAGLIMWVPCCFIYLSGAMYLLIKWFEEKGPATSTAIKFHNEY
jgi:putative membrane protein